jgi:magnesium-protoporphyrin O-methyltransferase
VYDKKGLNMMAKGCVEYLESRGVDGHTVLEVGGGIGALHIELLKAGAVSVINVELSHGYRDAATELLRREGLEERVEVRIGDFTQLAERLEADDVIMNRVICCYPDMERLMNAALSAASRFVAVTFPRDRIVARLWVGLESAYHRIRGVGFRPYVHSPAAILETAERAGFHVVFDDRDLMWHGVVFERVA